MARHYAQATIPALFERVRPFAADDRFSVREWAWLAVRPRLVERLGEAIAELAVWTGATDVNLRRFAVGALRPRGVWCKHIAELRAEPALGLPLLDPMRTEPEKYAQDSVGNWLNDAAKDNPDRVVALCRRWQTAAPDNAGTKRIIARAMRSVR